MLLDFQMPRKNGIQVVSDIRKYIQNKNIISEHELQEPEFVFMTAY